MIDNQSLRELAEQLQQAHDQLREAAMLLGGEACYAQAKIDVQYLVNDKHLELPEAMYAVYGKILAQLAAKTQ